MLHIILLDCALELVPSEISSMKQIQKHATRRDKKTTEILLDQSHHGRAMTKLSDYERRGRPDITFLSLMSILETPLCKEGLLHKCEAFVQPYLCGYPYPFEFTFHVQKVARFVWQTSKTRAFALSTPRPRD